METNDRGMGREIEVNWTLSFEVAELLCRYLELYSLHSFDGFTEDNCKVIIAMKTELRALLDESLNGLIKQGISEDDGKS
ncbi:MAG: hypothetical protein AAFX80_18795 [Cyanobacteria bacterium J06639_18]